ncbi:MAG: hypothetical protein ACXWXX_00410 [Candidatus Binatia bacterium]
MSGGEVKDLTIRQKFMRGDRVWVGEMPPYKSHFRGNCEAIVEGSYVELCSQHVHGDRERLSKDYSLHFPDINNSSSWYHESELTLIEARDVNKIYGRTE